MPSAAPRLWYAVRPNVDNDPAGPSQRSGLALVLRSE